MEGLSADPDFTAGRKASRQLTLQECFSNADDGVMVTREVQKIVGTEEPSCRNKLVNVVEHLSSDQKCFSSNEDCELLPSSRNLEQVSLVHKESIEESALNESEVLVDPTGVKSSGSSIVSEWFKLDALDDSDKERSNIVIKRKRRRVLSLRGDHRNSTIEKVSNDPENIGSKEDNKEKQSYCQQMGICGKECKMESEDNLQRVHGCFTELVQCEFDSVPQDSKDSNIATGDDEVTCVNKVELNSPNDEEIISVNVDESTLCARPSKSRSMKDEQSLVGPLQVTLCIKKLQPKFSSEKLESKNIFQAESIKSTGNKSKSKNKTRSQKVTRKQKVSNRIVPASGMASGGNRTAVTESVCASPGVESLTSVGEDFGRITTDDGDDGVVMMPSTPQEKQARRLARERQLRNMRAWEMAEMRRERALKRTRRISGNEAEVVSNSSSSSCKRIKWKEDNLVSVFEYSPKEELEDTET